MLPKGNTGPIQSGMKGDNAAAPLVVEDYLKKIISRRENANYKPWKNSCAPPNPHSCFGDFPKEYMKD